MAKDVLLDPPGHQVSNWACTECGKILSDHREVAYSGISKSGHFALGAEHPTPFVKYSVLCYECYNKLTS